jgi:capsular polysaccharide transport system permease protein
MQTQLGAIIQGAGFSRSLDDIYSVHDYMLSRDALSSVNMRFDLRKAFTRKGVDLFSRFNPLGFDNSLESLFLYYQQHVDVFLNSSSSISTLKTRAFTPSDAYRLNEILLQQAEDLINRLNERGRNDLIRYALREVADAERKSRIASLALSDFRNKHGVFDPVGQSALQLQQVAKLQDELIATKTQLAQVKAFTPLNPQIPVLEQRVSALQQEINEENAKITGVSGNKSQSLTNKAVEYERLSLDRVFAEKQLAAAMASLEQARNEAQRKQLYLERIVQPNSPDIAIEPHRMKAVLTTLVVGLVVWGIFSMLFAGIREHHD